MAYSSVQISDILLKADKTMYKLGDVAYENMFDELDEAYDYERDIIFIYKKAVEYGDNYFVGTLKLDQIVERLAAKLNIYDYGTLAPIYVDVYTQVDQGLNIIYVLKTTALDLGPGLTGSTDFSQSQIDIDIDYTYLNNVYVIDERTLTINGVTYDLSANRTWSLNLNSVTGQGSVTTNSITVGSVYLTNMTAGSGALYYGVGANRLTLANYNAGGSVYIEVNGGQYSAVFGSDLSFTSYGTIAGVFNNATVDTDKFIVSDGGVLKYRTGTQLLSDIGGQPAGNYVPESRTLTINGTTYDLSANRSWAVGTVTSVNMTVPTGFTISGNPITGAGTLALAMDAGYSIPTTASQANWNTAYNDSIVSAAVTGTTTKTLTLNQQDGGTVVASWTDYDTAPVTSVFGRTGAILAQSGDYTTTLVTEGTNLYYTDARSRAAITLTTIGTSGAATYSSLTGVLNIPNYGSVLTGYVPYTGATQDLDLGTYGLIGDFVRFNPSSSNIPSAEGVMSWNSTDGTVYLSLKGNTYNLPIGQSLVARVVNNTGAQLNRTDYRVVRVSAAQGQRLAVSLAQANNDANSADTLGIVCENISNNQEGFVVNVGQITEVNTTGSLQGETWADGDSLYLSATTPGVITNIKPVAPNHGVRLGYVEYAHSQHGKIYVKIDNGYELDELHDVEPTPYVNKGVLYRDTTLNLWKSATIQTLLGYTPANQATTLTINGTTYDLSANRTWSVGTITSLTGEATASGTGAVSVTLTNSAVIGKVLTGLNLSGGGTIASTDSILQAFGKVQNQISALVGGVMYKGVWDANVNSPSLTSSVGNKGDYYIVNVAGSTNLNGITDWRIGDWAIFNGATWDKVDNTDAVSSVNTFTGAVSLTTANIPEVTNLYYLDSRARAALSFTAGSGNYSTSTGVITIPTNTNHLTNGAGFITLTSLSASSPLSYNNLTGGFSISQSSGSTDGYLSSTDWTTFNNKQSALTNPVTGTGTTNYIPKFTGSTTLGNSSMSDDGSAVTVQAHMNVYGGDVRFDDERFVYSFAGGTVGQYRSGVYYDGSGLNQRFYINNAEQMRLTSTGLGIGTTSPAVKLHVDGTGTQYIRVSSNTASTFQQLFAQTGGAGVEYKTLYRFVDTDNGERARLDASGNLGINTTTFATDSKLAVQTSGGKFDVRGIGVASIVLESNGGMHYNAPTGNFHKFQINNSTLMELNGSGNLGLGVTPSAWNLGTAMQFTAGSLWSLSTTDFNVMTNTFYSSGYKYVNSTGALRYFQDASTSSHQWFNAVSGTAGNAISFTQAMTLNASGRLLLGTTTDDGSSRLQVSGNGLITTTTQYTSISANGGLFIKNSSTSANGVIGLTGDGFILQGKDGASTAYPILLQPYGGNIGIGVTSPNAKLEILGTSSDQLRLSTASTEHYRIGRNASTGYLDFYGSQTGYTGYTFGGVDGERMRIIANGNVGIGTSSPSYPLDIVGFANSTSGFRVTDGTLDNRISWSSGNVGFFGTISNHPIAFNTNASEKMRLTSGGSLGIGTSSPVQKLDVEGTIRTASGSNYALFANNFLRSYASGTFYFDNATVGQSFVWRMSNASALDTTALTLNSSGNLGLGVTPSAWNANSKALQLPQYVSLSHQNNASLNLMSFALETSSNAFTYADTGVYPLRYNQNPNNGAHSWYIAGTGTAGNAITFTQAMTLNASGRLLLGQTSDNGTDRFQVTGSVSSQGTTTNSIGFVTTNTTASKTHRAYTDVNGSYIIYDATLDSNRLTIASTGAATFSSSVTANAMTVSQSTNGSDAILSLISKTSAGNSRTVTIEYDADTEKLFFKNAGTTVATMVSDGNVGIGTSSPGTALQIDASKSNTTVGSPFNSDILRLNNTNATTNALHGILLTRTNGASLTSVGAIMSQVTTQTVGNAASDLLFYTVNADTISERMRITSGGNVGIKTTVTSAEGNLFLGAIGTTEGGQIVLQKGTSQTYATHLDNFTDTFRIMSGTDTTSNDVRLTVNMSNGNTIIGGSIKTAAPTGYSAQPWKLGDATSGTITPNYYIKVEINGQIYSIPALQGTP